MFPCAKVKIKISDNILDKDKLERINFDAFDGDYIRIGILILRGDGCDFPTIDDISELTEVELNNSMISMGSPFPSTNSEVLKVAPQLKWLMNIGKAGGVYKYDEKEIEDNFDFSSFTIEPIYDKEKIDSVRPLFTDEFVFNICLYMSYTHRELFTDDYLSRNKFEKMGYLASQVIKIFPAKPNNVADRCLYRDFLFSKLVYPITELGPGIEDNGIGVIPGTNPDFYSKFDTKMIANKTERSVAIVFRRGTCNFYQLLTSMYDRYTPLDIYDIINDMIYHSYIGLLLVHRNGIIHGDYHLGNIVCIKKSVNFPDEFKDVPLCKDESYTFMPIDFGKSYYFTEEKWHLFTLETSMPEFYAKHKEIIHQKYQSEREEFAVATTVIDMLGFILAVERVSKEKLEQHKERFAKVSDKLINRIKHMRTWIQEGFEEYITGNNSIIEIFSDRPVELEKDIFGGLDNVGPDELIDPSLATDRYILQRRPLSYIGKASRLPVYSVLKKFYPEYFIDK